MYGKYDYLWGVAMLVGGFLLTVLALWLWR